MDQTPTPPPTAPPPAALWSWAFPYSEETMTALRAFGDNPRATRQKVIEVASRWVRWFLRDEHQLHHRFGLSVPQVLREDIVVTGRCQYTFQWTAPDDWSINEKLFLKRKIEEYGHPGYLVWLVTVIEAAGLDIRTYKRQAEARSNRMSAPVEDVLRAPRIPTPVIYDIRPTGRIQTKEPNHGATPQQSAPEHDLSEDGDLVPEL